MRTADELLADARQLSPDERRRLIALVQDSLQVEFAADPPRGWTRDLWEETPEYRVSAAQAISVKEVRRRLDEQSWFSGLFQ